ncbi:MAG TPA: AAA family ATPase [Marmoricola sp.]|nr:AAA family ATPase [Marmoricola sp.]
MITTLAIHGYRSLRDVVVPLGPITVVSGANGTGKSSLYRALGLLARCASGGLVGALAREGGLDAVLWAGPETISSAMRRGEVPVQGTRRTGPVSLMLGFCTDDWGYLIDIGLPRPDQTTMFGRDPLIKREVVFTAPMMRPAGTTIARAGTRVQVRDGRSKHELDDALDQRISMIGDLAAADDAPELRALRHHLRGWRFHDSFRVDADAPSRRPQVGTWTPVLADDGSDLAPAIQTILESASARPFLAALDLAFPGIGVHVVETGGLFALQVTQPGLLRPLQASELSDGTLRFLLLATALLSPRPPSLLVLNEPESSMHPDLLPGLAQLIAAASRRTQVIVVSHAESLVDALADAAPDDVQHHTLTKVLGETLIEDQGLMTRPQWNWGRR